MSYYLAPMAAAIGGYMGFVTYGEEMCAWCPLQRKAQVVVSATCAAVTSIAMNYIFPRQEIAAIGMASLVSYLSSKHIIGPSTKDGMLHRFLIPYQPEIN